MGFRRYLDSFPLHWQVLLAAKLIVPFANHHLRRPLRRRGDLGLTEEELRKSKRAAMYDLMFDELLAGYRQLTHRSLHKDTSQMLYLLRRLAREHDDEFERRTVCGESLDRDEVLRTPSVKKSRERFTKFVSQSNDPSKIFEHLKSLFETHYDEHLRRWEAARDNPTPKKVLNVLELDSGLQLVATMDCVALFNDHPIDETIQKEFHHLGMAGKMANDMTDLGFDVQEGVPNFLHAVMLQYPDEWKIASEAGPNVGSKGRKWWLENCPGSIQEFFAQVEYHYCQITSARLRASCDLMVWPTIAGFDYKNARR